MSVSPPATWQPTLLARPSHGLLARRGWVWLAVPGLVIVVFSTILAGFLGSSSQKQNGTTSSLIGLLAILGIALLVIGLPVRAVVVHRHRRRWAMDPATLPTLSGRYPGPPAGGATAALSTAAAPEPARKHAGRHLTLGILLTVWVAGCGGLVLFFSAQGAYQGWRAVRLQHSSSAAHLTAVLDFDTSVRHGRGTYYYDRVSYTVDGTTETDVQISAARAQHAGDRIRIIVRPSAPRTAIAASDHGWDDLIPATIVLVFVAAAGVAIVVVPRRRARRNIGDGAAVRFG